jgi:hypothetical protein
MCFTKMVCALILGGCMPLHDAVLGERVGDLPLAVTTLKVCYVRLEGPRCQLIVCRGQQCEVER